MAFKSIASSTDNLDSAAENFGFFADNVVVLVSATTAFFSTYEGADYVYTGRSASGETNVVKLGTGNDRFEGGQANDTVHDGSGNDLVSLGGGSDNLQAGSGNDTYIGGDGTDVLDFRATTDDGYGLAVDNFASITVDLAVSTAQNFGAFGFDRISGFEIVIGSFGNDRLFGTSAADQLLGSLGNDRLDGRAGADLLRGDSGSDTLTGGSGADTLYVFDLGFGAARDVLKYISISDSGPTATTWDTIQVFDSGATATDDRIDLSAIDANPRVSGNQAFVWRGSAGFTSSASGEVRLVVSGTDTLVYVDNDADTAAEMIIKVQAVTGLTAADFIL